jgi:hypothetical protein
MTEQEAFRIRPLAAGDRDAVMALAPRLAEWVAPWREPAGVLRAVRGWWLSPVTAPRVSAKAAQGDNAKTSYRYHDANASRCRMPARAGGVRLPACEFGGPCDR